jgi:hypothetical protein
MFASRRSLIALLPLLLFSIVTFASDEWLPVSKVDLEMKELPQAPGVHAALLYHSVDRNDPQSSEKQYYRIKILDEEGKKYANVELEPYGPSHNIRDIKARTIKPDGTVVPFAGKVFEKTVKLKEFKLIGKTFSIPDVQVGSIVEYRYTMSWDSNSLFGSQWLVQDNLFTREGVFTLVPYMDGGWSVSWMNYFLPKNAQPKDERNKVTLKVNDIPAFEREEYMPPENEIRARVEFTYSLGERAKNTDEYWKKEAKDWYKRAEDFMNKKKAAEREVAASTHGEIGEAKLRKLYDRVQKLRNLTFEKSKSEKEESREHLKDNNNIEDVLSHGYAFHNALVRTFTALARSAGFDATLVRIQDRYDGFFHKEARSFDKLDTELSLVRLDGKELYLDPGVPYCPFGRLRWSYTGVPGMVLDKEDAKWVNTPMPSAEESVVQRVANLVLDWDGTVSGELQIHFRGQEALAKRLSARDDDDAERKKDLEKMLKRWLPSTGTFEFVKIDDWNATSDNFDITVKLSIPGFATSTGKRVMLPISIFAGSDAHPFTHARRVHPVYFSKLYKEVDSVKIQIPEGLQVETLPETKKIPTEFADFALSVSKDSGSITIARQMTMNGLMFKTEYYSALRNYLDRVKAASDEQAILRAIQK